MTARQFSAFQEEMKGQFSDNPTIIFEFYTATIITRAFLRDKIELAFSSLPLLLLVFGWPGIIFIGLFLPVWLIYFYSQFIGVGTLTIDFITKTVTIKNKFAFLNWRRRILKVKSEFAFSEIIEIGHKHGPFLDRLGRGIKRRSLLFFETDSDWEIFASQFSNEEKAENIVNALRKFLLNKEEIIA